MGYYYFTSARLGFRDWTAGDLSAYIAMNADPRVMEFFPSQLSPAETAAHFERIQEHFREYGYGLFAVELLERSPFIGFIGFSHPRFEAHFTPCIEIGWRLDARFWGKGLATEGAGACLEFGFTQLHFDEVYSFTALSNTRSERVMQKIGMQKVGEFGHPLLEADSPLYLHALYMAKP